MLDVFFIILFAIFPFLMWVFIKNSGFKVTRISIVSFVILSIFFFDYVGILPLYFGWNQYYFDIGVQDKYLIFHMFLFTAWSMFALLLGAVLINKLLVKVHSGISYLYRPLNNKEIFLLFLVFIICGVVFIFYIKAVPEIAMTVAISEGFREARISRSLMGNDFFGKVHMYNYFKVHLLDFATFSFFAHWLVSKTRTSLLMFFTVFLVAVLSAVIATEKAPIIWLLIGLYLVLTFVRNDGVYSLKKFFKIIPLLIGILVVTNIYFMGSQDLEAAVSSIIGRIFSGGIVPAYFYLDYFPKHHDFLWGISFPNPGGFLFHDPYPLTVEISKWINSAFADQTIVGSAPTIFWAEMYANFGVFGVIVSPFIVGSGLCVIDILANKLENTPIKIGFMVWLLLHYNTLAETGLSGFLMDSNLLITGGVVLAVIAMANNGRIVRYRA